MLSHRLSILAHKERELGTQFLDDRYSASDRLVTCLKVNDGLLSPCEQGSVLQADIDDWGSKGWLACI